MTITISPWLLVAIGAAAVLIALVWWDPAILRPYRLALVTGLALVAALIGGMLTGRDEPRGLDEPTDPRPPPPYTPPAPSPPSTRLEELDDEVDDATIDAVDAAADVHRVDPERVRDGLEWLDEG